LHEFITQPLTNQMRKRGIFATYLELNATGDKDLRISSLAPHYRLGHVYHNPQTCQKLENQLQWHPKSKLKDVADAFSYITKIMDEHYLYFDPDEEQDQDGKVEDEYAYLEDEDAMGDEWRLV